MRRAILSDSAAAREKRGEEPVCQLVLDSGAFSAWKLGVPIDLKAYTKWLVEHQHWIAHAVALDMIIPEDPARAAQESFDNYKYMRSKGIKPIPVVHVGEDLDWLKRYLDLGCDYIGLSASSIVSKGKADEWYSQAWSHLVDSKGRPIVRAHAFGEGRTESLLRFPWTSSDTATWIYSSQRTGAIQFGDSKRLAFRNDGLSSRAAPDIGRMEGEEREAMLKLLRDRGVDAKLLERRDSQSAFITRCYLSALHYIAIEARVNAVTPILFKERYGLWTPPAHPGEGLDILNFNLYLVMGANHYAWACLSRARHRRVLASYFYVGTARFYDQLRNYVYAPEQTIRSAYPFSKFYSLLEENLL